ncbi:MAG: hypothetical protein HYZ26_02530 [Chloroflexi bacterium]|nr:hypothetical protein [Chloroflexota bacterium]
MSINQRIEDALLLWDQGNFEGAFLLVLVAISATSRRTYPNRKRFTDKEAFEKFLAQGVFERITVEYRGELQPVYHIFYKWLRCELIHEATLPIDIEFMPDEGRGTLSIRAGGYPEYVLKISYNWFFELIHVVKEAPANHDIFPQVHHPDG